MVPSRHIINAERFSKLSNTHPKRRIIEDAPLIKKAPEENGRFSHFIHFPFRELGIMISGSTPFQDFYSTRNNTYYFGIKNEEELDCIKEWCDNYKKIVFLRSLLGCCLSLDCYTVCQNGITKKTKLGKCIRKLKYGAHDQSLLNNLARYTIHKLKEMPYYCEIDAVACIPPTNPNKFCLPFALTKKIASGMEIIDLSECLTWGNKSQSLKSLPAADRWQALEDSHLEWTHDIGNTIRNKKVLLFDDVYQSGTTMHYVAQKIQDQGIDFILGLSLAKDLSDG